MLEVRIMHDLEKLHELKKLNDEAKILNGLLAKKLLDIDNKMVDIAESSETVLVDKRCDV